MQSPLSRRDLLRHCGVGFGTLGQDAGRKLKSLGFDVAGWSREPKEIPGFATYAGPSPLTVGLPAVRSVTRTFVGAGTLTFRIATAHRHGLRVLTLGSPTRIAVDVAH